jgi:hypothetical protein
VTKRELADLIVSGMDDFGLYMNGPVPSRAPTFVATPQNVAEYIAKKHTLAELERWADELTR